MQTQQSAAFTAIPILTLKDLGFERTVSLDQASRGLAERSEAQIVRWVQFPAGALFFVLVPGDPKSGALYVFDRRKRRVLLRRFQRPELGRLQPGRVRGAGTNTPDFPARPAAVAAQPEVGIEKDQLINSLAPFHLRRF